MTYPASVEKALAYLKAADIPKYLKNRPLSKLSHFKIADSSN